MLLTGWTARNIDINGDNAVDTLDGIIAIIEFTARVGALTHADNPLWIWHLLPK